MKYLVVLAAAILQPCRAYSQLTYVGDQIIVGDLGVGVTGTTGSLTVTGDTGNLATPGLVVSGDGGVVFSGSHGVGSIPASGPGTRFLWYPKKSALRAGRVTTDAWNDDKIGAYSIAMGNNSIASAEGAVALRGQSTAYGAVALGGGRSLAANAVAIGDFYITPFLSFGAMATGTSSMALGPYSISSANMSVAVMGGVASGTAAISLGVGQASGFASVSMQGGNAIGENSLSFGDSSVASGNESAGIGSDTSAVAFKSFVIGKNNVIEGNGSTWIETDPIFVIGNGTGGASDAPEVKNRNALVVRKNGDIEVTGKMKLPRQGDILMGEFGE